MNKPFPTLSSLVGSLGALALADKSLTEKKLPTPPTLSGLVEGLDALALADKSPVEKKLPEPPGPINFTQPDHHDTFVGGFSPELLALNAAPDHHRRPPLVPPLPAANQNARAAALQEAKAPPVPLHRVPMPIPMPVPQTGKKALTKEHALKSLDPNTRTKRDLAPPFVIVPPRPQPDCARVAPKPALAVVTRLSQTVFNLSPTRPHSASFPSFRRNTIQCNGTTKAGEQCRRQVKLPATHFHLDPTPVLYCHQHKKTMITAQIGFYVRKAGNMDKFVEFSHYIPKYLQMDTQLALRVEMEKATSPADVPGYIYTFEIRNPKRSDVIQLKVGRTVNLVKRLDQWDKQCGSKVQIPRGWWPGTVENDNEAGVSLLKGNITAGDPGPFCHRVERLVHIELADLSLHAPYLDSGWVNNTSDHTTRPPNRKTSAEETTCPDCGVVHREIFVFPRPEKGRYKGKEWDLIVKPVIEKWGRFVKEYYD